MGNPPLSIFIPFYNEEEAIRQVVEDSLSYLDSLNREYELILVDDGSNDRTTNIIHELEEENPNIEKALHNQNRGYGNALKTGFQQASNPLIAYMDGDGQFDIRDLDKLLPQIENYDLVAGVREERKDASSRIFIGEGFTNLIQKIFGIDYSDIDCGLKVVRKEVIETVDLKTDRTVDAELLIKSDINGFSIKQVGVNHFSRKSGESEASGMLGVRPGLILTTLLEIYHIREDIK